MAPSFCWRTRRLNKGQLSCSNSASHSLVFCCAFSLRPFYSEPRSNTDRSWEYVSTIDYEWNVWTSSQRFLGTIWVSVRLLLECQQRVFSFGSHRVVIPSKGYHIGVAICSSETRAIRILALDSYRPIVTIEVNSRR